MAHDTYDVPWRAWRVHLVAVVAAARILVGRGDLDRLARDLAAGSGLMQADATMVELLLSAAPPPLLLDARTVAEFEVSHLPGAMRVEPSAHARSLTVNALAGRTVVLYCAVGVRSTLVALRIGSELRRRGASSVVNLAGGIFAWHRDGRPLVDAHGPVASVHPYSRLWGRLRHRPWSSPRVPLTTPSNS